MKKDSQIKQLIKDLTRLRSNSDHSATLRESPVLQSFSSDDVIPNPFSDLPNVSSLWLRTNRLDPLLERYGVQKKLEPEMTFTDLCWRIKAANRYLRIMHFRMSKLLKTRDGYGFWIFALMLMQKSQVLRSVALRKLNRNWHRVFKFGHVKILLQLLDEHINEMTTDLYIVRNYVDKVKPDGTLTHRPIGNPYYSNRMYLYLLQSFWTMYFSKYIDQSQHAYRPGQGVPTALSDLREHLERSSYRYIWEFDLKGAFPSVNIPVACASFAKIGLPEPLAKFVEAMSLRTIERVDLAPRDQYKLIPEPKFDRQVELVDAFPSKFLAGKDLWSVSNHISELSQLPENYVSRDRIKLHAKYEIESTEIHDLLMDDDWSFSTTRKVPLPTAKTVSVPPCKGSTPRDLKDHVGPNLLGLHGAIISGPAFTNLAGPKPEILGFPQGSGLSPIAFNTVFEYAALRNHFKLLHPSVKVISYADDFLLFSEVDIPGVLTSSSEIMKSHGLEINTAKSRQIKSDGAWCVSEVKFLGTTFHFAPEGPLIEGAWRINVEGTPRSGEKLPFTKANMVEAFTFRDKQIAKVLKGLGLEDISVSEVIAAWGQGRRPFSLIPLEVMKGASRVSQALIDLIREIKDETSIKFDKPLPQSFGSGFRESSGVPKDPLEKSIDGLNKYPNPLNYLKSRVRGLITSRLHAGSWQPLAESADRSLRSPEKTEGRSWLELSMNEARAMLARKAPPAFLADARKAMDSGMLFKEFLDSLGIYNSTSYASEGILKYLRDPKSVKITKRGLTYRKTTKS